MVVGAKCAYHFLCRGIQHIFNKDPVAGIRTVYKDMSNSAYQFAVLDDGTAGHERLSLGITVFKCKTTMLQRHGCFVNIHYPILRHFKFKAFM